MSPGPSRCRPFGLCCPACGHGTCGSWSTLASKISVIILSPLLPPSRETAIDALEITDLGVDVDGLRVVDGVSFTVPAGGRTALVGASGSGKSLTAAAVLGHLPVTAHATGSVRVAGHEVLGRPTPQRPAGARPSMVFQDSATALHPLVRVGPQVAEPLRRQLGSARLAARAAQDLLAAVGLPDPVQVVRRYPGELSGGQRQRVCIALALACRAPLVVADEPTTALDVVTQAAIVSLLRARTGGEGGPALLFITHDLAVAAQLCTEVVVLEAGRVVEVSTVDALLSSPTDPSSAALVDAAHLADSFAVRP